MQALGELNPVSRVEAEIQKYIADFLGLKVRLIELKSNPSLQIQGKASSLLTRQIQLEGELKANLANIEKMKSTGVFDISDTLALGLFASSLVKHINDVKDLERQVIVTTPGWKPESETTKFIKNWGIPIGLLGIGLLMIGMSFRR